ncbi:MAG: FAD-binding oxidoreductase [Anaerolineales bacterium]|nr:MAG: FAD-binding oxidoreductase [Anaerolineales bacterium]
MGVANQRWWGWGTLDRSEPLERRPLLGPTLRAWLHLPEEALEQEVPPVDLASIKLRESRLDDPMLVSLRKTLGADAVRADDQARVEHAYGKSYGDLLRLRAGHVPRPPDAVVCPAEEGHVAALLSWCAERDVAVIPFGGGTGVEGGLEPPAGDMPAIALDLSQLNHMLSLDPVSRKASFQAGARGPEIENALNEQGFTLGHSPQSFEFSTLGGWIATGAAGYASAAGASIEAKTQALRAVTPVGMIDAEKTVSGGGRAGLLAMLVGSAGAFGVITEATLSVDPLPQARDVRAIAFPSLQDGLAALRELNQDGRLAPAVASLWDASAVAAWEASLPARGGAGRLADGLASRRKQKRGYPTEAERVLLLAGFEGDAGWIATQWQLALGICGSHDSTLIGNGVARTWEQERYAWPYLRDTLVGRGVMVDVVGASADWATLPAVREALLDALRGAVRTGGGGPGFVQSRVAHAGAHGACVYATFFGRQVDDEDPESRVAQWQAVRDAALEAVLAAGGRLCLGCGVGCARALRLERQADPTGFRAMRALKTALDPTGVMNPGVLPPRASGAN